MIRISEPLHAQKRKRAVRGKREPPAVTPPFSFGLLLADVGLLPAGLLGLPPAEVGIRFPVFPFAPVSRHLSDTAKQEKKRGVSGTFVFSWLPGLL